MVRSFWLDEPVPPLPRRTLSTRPDVEIIGGGVTGCACALALARGGLTVRLHEAREVATGASGRNGGFALRGAALPYDVARDRLGPDRAKALWRLTEAGLNRLEELAGDALRRKGSVRLAVDDDEAAELRREYETLVSDGFDAEWTETLRPPLRGRFSAALVHPGDGALQPARWVRRLAHAAAAAGTEIREHSRVALGDLEAERVVVATDGYGTGLVPELDGVVTPTRGQMLVTEALPQLLFPRPHYARRGLDYWHQTPDRRLVIGGWRDVSLESELTAEEAINSVIQEKIEAFVRELLSRPARVTHRWAGIFGVTPDRLPLVGPVPRFDGRVWIAAGYSGHGNVLGLVCGELVAKALLGDAERELALFDPGRLL
jgi:glycine/D-amino acid oxidase-like deaminating enzyme